MKYFKKITELILVTGFLAACAPVFSSGVAAITSKEKIKVPGFNVEVCSTAGAGDAFDAGFIAAQLRNTNLLDALIYANAVAAIKVTRKDARSAPTHTETIEFMRKRNIQVGMDLESN